MRGDERLFAPQVAAYCFGDDLDRHWLGHRVLPMVHVPPRQRGGYRRRDPSCRTCRFYIHRFGRFHAPGEWIPADAGAVAALDLDVGAPELDLVCARRRVLAAHRRDSTASCPASLAGRQRPHGSSEGVSRRNASLVLARFACICRRADDLRADAARAGRIRTAPFLEITPNWLRQRASPDRAVTLRADEVAGRSLSSRPHSIRNTLIRVSVGPTR